MPKPGCVCSTARKRFWSPAEFLQKRTAFSLGGIGDDFPKHRSELESMSAIAGCDHQARAFRIASNPEMSVVRVAIHAQASGNNGRAGQRGEGAPQKFTQIAHLLGSHGALRRIGRHLAPGAMLRDFHDAVPVYWKSVIAGGGNVRSENREPFGREKLRP